MATVVEIQNIEQMRQREGIDDVELREEVRRLRVGDQVKLTFLTGTRTCETLPVRITRIRGTTFRGALVVEPASAALSELRVGSPVVFTWTHIHSIQKRRPE
jgi:hypothetical protein